MYLGVDYYPEHWERSMIDEDLQNIKEMGCNLIRIADFAWNILEPEEGVYDFDLFDEVVQKADAIGLKVMMCIPTATMPRWVNLKYPEIMAEDEHGNPQPYGGRRGYCYNSKKYQQLAVAITKAMAEHYKTAKNIVAWQLDNEIGHEGSDMCYCENCHREFVRFVKDQYESIDQLNENWGTNFWAQSYDRFEDIPLPKQAYTAQNPSLRLFWERFRSKSCAHFLRIMYDQLKAVIPDANVLHDFEGGIMGKHFSPFEIADFLDDIAYNNYPVWGGTVEPMKPWEVALSLDFARGFKGRNFWITEEIMGAQGHDIIGCAIKPNQGSTWAMQALAHGVKSFLIFRYRGYTKGAEQYCYGIIDSDNRKRRKYYEVQKLYRSIMEHEALFETPIKTDVAIVYDYDSAASFRIQRQSDVFGYQHEMEKLYKPLYARDIMADVITQKADLDPYKLVIVPYMIVMSDAYKQKLKDYVARGGTVVFTARTAWKDLENNLVLGKMLPVDLEDLVGGEVYEQESLLHGQRREVIDQNGNLYQGEVFADMLKVTSAKELMCYHHNAFGNYAAVTENAYGEGKCYYLGTSLEDKALDELFTRITGKTAKADLNEETVIRNGQTIHMNYADFTSEIK